MTVLDPGGMSNNSPVGDGQASQVLGSWEDLGLGQQGTQRAGVWMLDLRGQEGGSSTPSPPISIPDVA